MQRFKSHMPSDNRGDPTLIPSNAGLERNVVTSALLDHKEADFNF
jgi:hypothetical protein